MKALEQLPENYSEIYRVDLQKDKKIAVFINLLAVALLIALVVPALFISPLSALFDMENGITPFLVRFAAIGLLSVAYPILHELVHGIAMKLCGTKKVKYGFTGLYAFAGSDCYYDKKSYIFIALAPVVVWGIVLSFVIAFVPTDWFWVIYWIQLFNLSGAAGDLFVTFKFLRMPKDILVRDYGVNMFVFSKQ